MPAPTLSRQAFSRPGRTVPLKERSATQSCFINELRENWPNPPQWLDRIPADPQTETRRCIQATHTHPSLRPSFLIKTRRSRLLPGIRNSARPSAPNLGSFVEPGPFSGLGDAGLGLDSTGLLPLLPGSPGARLVHLRAGNFRSGLGNGLGAGGETWIRCQGRGDGSGGQERPTLSNRHHRLRGIGHRHCGRGRCWNRCPGGDGGARIR